MPKTSLKYAQDIPKIHKIYAQDMPKTCPRSEDMQYLAKSKKHHLLTWIQEMQAYLKKEYFYFS